MSAATCGDASGSQAGHGYRLVHPATLSDSMHVYFRGMDDPEWSGIDATSSPAEHGSSQPRWLTGARPLSWTTSTRCVRPSARLAAPATSRSTPSWFSRTIFTPSLTLPSNDADFPGRWRRIKGNFSNALIGAGLDLERWPNGDLALWQRRFWEHTIRDDGDFARHVDYIHFNPVKHDWRGGCATGRIRRFTDTSGKAGCRTIGQATSARAQQISESRARRRSPHERGDVRATYASKPPRISLRSSGLRLLFCEKWQFQNKVRLRLAIHIIKMSGLGLLRR